MRLILIVIYLLGFFPSLIAQQKEDTPSCLKKVEKYINDSDYYKALTACDKCIKKNQNLSQLYYKRGLINLYLNHRYQAASDFQKALSLGSFKAESDIEDLMRFYSDTTFIIKNITDSLVFAELQPELDYRRGYTMADTLQGMLRPERTCFDVVYENLTVKVLPETKMIEGSNEITFRAMAPSKTIQVDLFDNYEILDITYSSKSLEYSRLHHAIFITFDEELEKGRTYTVSIKYRGMPREAPNPPWDGGFVWKKNGDRHFLGVSCEHLGASSWWPNKDHLSDKPDSMDINILAPSGYDVVANGNLLDQKEESDGFTRFQWHVSYPINNYNVTFYIGDFVNFSESYLNTHNKTVDIDYYVLERNLPKAQKYYADTRKIITVFEDLFGDYAFPNDGLAYVESPFAGMEHQSAIAIGGDYGKDSIYSMIGSYDRLVIHETAHEWWGNAVAVADMADIWISEGFATYSEHLFVEREFGEEKYIETVADNMSGVMNIWPMVGRRNVNFDAFLGQDVYSKGAAMVHNLRCIFDNDEEFFKMIKDFYALSKLKTSNSQDFVVHASQYTSKELDGFFKVFMDQKNPPTLEYTYHLRSGKFYLKYRWTNVPNDFEMPFLIVFNGLYGERIEASTTFQEVNFDNVKNFYLPNPLYHDTGVNTKNAFTYYFAKFSNFK